MLRKTYDQNYMCNIDVFNCHGKIGGGLVLYTYVFRNVYCSS